MEKQKDTIIIRRMETRDVTAAARLEAEIFSSPWSEQAFAETLQCDYAYYYVAEMAGEGTAESIVGICGLRSLSGEGEITNVAVAERCRRMGVAGRMLKQVLSKGKELGIKDFTLEVRCSNRPAIDLYEKYGFKGEGVRRNFYEKPREDALIMWKRQEMSQEG